MSSTPSKSRRAFLLASAGLLCSCGGGSSDVGDGRRSDAVVIYRGEYPGWPWVASAPSGRLVCVFREGTVHGFCPTGRAMLTESIDGGMTWSAARVIANEPDLDDRNVAICVLSDSDWLVSYNIFTRGEVSQVLTIRTRDGGATWSQPQPVSDSDLRARSAAVLTSSGALVLPIYRSPGDGAVAARSMDDGRSWQLMNLPDAEGFVGDEWAIAEVSPGRLVGMHRNNHAATDGGFWKTESTSDGRTWTAPQKTNARSRRFPSPPHIAIHNGAPILVYSDERFVSVAVARSSDPELLQWNGAPVYQYRHDGKPIDDGSYPVSAQVSPTRRLIVDYEIHEGGHLITGRFVEPHRLSG